jgi:aminoglycoside 6'-N-acetyltransferase I
MTDRAAHVTIVDLDPKRTDTIDDTARLLHAAFAGRTHDWQDVDSARQTALASVGRERISRVAMNDRQVVGWVAAGPIYDGHVWELDVLVVDKGWRRSGIGRLLVADLERRVAERGGLTLWLGSDDENGETSLSGADLYADVPGAIRNIRNVGGHPFEFYQKLGFTIVGVLPDANGPGKPDIFLAKRVAPPSTP